MRGPQGWEWLVIALIVLLLFGARRLPDLARSLGRSMRIFRSELKEGAAEEPPAGPSEPGASARTDGTPDDRGPRA
jgi:sec-independent protein translocase protein TatA